jgi:hypothetical protein
VEVELGLGSKPACRNLVVSIDRLVDRSLKSRNARYTAFGIFVSSINAHVTVVNNTYFAFCHHLGRDHQLLCLLFLPMDHPEVVWDAELQDLLQDIRNSPLYDLESLSAECLPSDALPNNYLNSLDAEHKTVALTLRACLIAHIISKYRIIPHQYQLEATNGLEDRRDVLVNSGTGSRKTLCLIIIPNLLHPNTSSMTISPLKRLQTLQVSR